MADYGADITPIGILDWSLHTSKALLNPSFEDELTDTPAWPDEWTAAYETAFLAFRSFTSPNYIPETFGYGWLSVEDSQAVLDGTNTELRQFDTTAEAYEDFEEGWLGNEGAFDEWPADDRRLFDLTGDAYEDFEQEWYSRHVEKDARYITDNPFVDGGVPSGVRTRLNELKATYNAHIADATKHTAADTANGLSSADATDLASTVALINEAWVDCWVHVDDSGLAYHRADFLLSDVKPTMSEYPASTYNDAAALVNALMLHLDSHFSWSDNTGPKNVTAFVDYDVGTDPFAMVIAAEFDSGTPESVEDYEEEWDGNENALASFDPGDISERLFTTDGGTEAWEDYEETFAMTYSTAPGDAGDPETVDPTGMVQVELTGAFSLGNLLTVQTRTPSSTTWVSRQEFTSSPATAQLEDGYTEVRIYTDTWVGGSPAFAMRWRTLE